MVPPATPEHAELIATIRAAQDGDDVSIQKFLAIIVPAVRRTCRSVLGSGHADLEDTIQESLIASVKALPQYRFDSDVRRYVTIISYRLAINARKRGVAWWRRHGRLEDYTPTTSSISSAGDALLDGAVLVRRILDELSAVQSEALFMRVVLGFTVEEIAMVKGVSQNTVKTRLRRGKDTLSRKRGIWQRLFASRG